MLSLSNMDMEHSQRTFIFSHVKSNTCRSLPFVNQKYLTRIVLSETHCNEKKNLYLYWDLRAAYHWVRPSSQ